MCVLTCVCVCVCVCVCMCMCMCVYVCLINIIRKKLTTKQAAANKTRREETKKQLDEHNTLAQRLRSQTSPGKKPGVEGAVEEEQEEEALQGTKRKVKIMFVTVCMFIFFIIGSYIHQESSSKTCSYSNRRHTHSNHHYNLLNQH